MDEFPSYVMISLANVYCWMLGVLIMDKEIDIVHILRQYRHDWLNNIQLIKGYLELERVEKVQQIIHDLIQQARNESDLSNLKIDEVASRLLTFNWDNHPYVLTFEVLRGETEQEWQDYEKVITVLLEEIFTCLDILAKQGEENELYLIFNDLENLKLEIDFHGQVKDREKLVEKITKIQSIYNKFIKIIEWNDDGFYMTVVFQAD